MVSCVGGPGLFRLVAEPFVPDSRHKFRCHRFALADEQGEVFRLGAVFVGLEVIDGNAQVISSSASSLSSMHGSPSPQMDGTSSSRMM